MNNKPSNSTDTNSKYVKTNTVSRSSQGTPSSFSNSNSTYIKGTSANNMNGKPSESGKGCKV
jgi:hypothetical protein